MNKLDALIIRACKCHDPMRRLESIYNRFWCVGATEQVVWYAMMCRLVSIISRYELTAEALENMIDDFNPDRHWRLPVGFNEWCHSKKAAYSLQGVIRFTAKAKFPGLPAPRAFREGGKYA